MSELHQYNIKSVPKLAISLCFIVLLLFSVYPNDISYANESPQETKNVLILIGTQYGLPTIDMILPGMMEVFQTNGISLTDLYVEFLDVQRSTDPGFRQALATMLEQKYVFNQPQVIIAINQGAVDFMAREGSMLFGDTPLFILERHPNLADQSRKVVTFIARQDIEGTVNYALSLYPRTNRVIVLMGPDDTRSSFFNPLIAALNANPSKPIVETTAELSYEEMLAMLSIRDSRTIGFYGSYFQDLTGRSFIPAEVASQISKVSHIPVFAFLDSHINAGLTGGSVAISTDIGKFVAHKAMEYLEGSLRLDAKITSFDIPNQGIFNYPNLRKTGASMAALPSGALVINRPKTIWEQYREIVLITSISLIILLGLTLGLIIKTLQQRLSIKRLRLLEVILGASEEKYRILFETMSPGVIYQDASGKITSANPAAERILCLSFDQMIGKTSMDPRWKMIDGDGRQITGDEHPAMIALRTGVKVGPVIRGVYVPETDEYLWLSITATPLFKDGEESAYLAYATFDDITLIKRQEKTIEDQRRLLETIVNHLPVGVNVLSGDDFRIMLANPTYRAFAPGKEMIGLSWDELWPETGQEFNTICQQVLETGIPFSTFDQLNTIKNSQTAALEDRYFSWHLHRIALPENQGWGLLGTAWETTEIVKANLRLKRIINTENIGVMFWNFEKGSMIDANDTFLNWTGYDRTDLVAGNLTWQRLTPDEYHAVSIAEMEKLHRTGKVGPYEKEYNCKDGSKKWMLFAGSAIGSTECVEFCIDISELKQIQQEIEQKDRLISEMGRVARIGGWEFDPEDHTISWTDETFLIHGMSPTENLEVDRGLCLYPSESRTVLQDALEISLRKEECIDLSIPFISIEGEERWVNIIGEPVKLNSKIHRIVGSWQDITERRRTEVELRESEEKFRSLFHDHAVVKLLIEPETGLILDANEAAAQFYGWSVQRLKTMNIGQINTLPPEILQKQLHNARSINKTAFDFEHRKSDGSIAPVQVFSSLVVINNQEILHSIVYDISDKKAAERQIRLLNRAVESSSVSIMITDTKGTIEYVNPYFCMLTGFQMDEALGNNPRFLKSGNHSTEFYKNLWASLSAGKEWTGEFHNKKKNGEEYWESAIISPIYDEYGVIANFVAVKEDITERKRITDQLEVTLGIKEKLVQELSHRSYNVMQIMQGLLNYRAHIMPTVSIDRFATDVSDQIQAMSIAYRGLQDEESLSKLSLETFIIHLTQTVTGHDYGSSSISLLFDLKPLYILIDTAIPLGIVLNDLLKNLMRSRFDPKKNKKPDLAVTISSNTINEEEVEIRIMDSMNSVSPLNNGDVQPEDELELAFSLVKQQLGGTLETGGTPDTEWTYRLCFKNNLYEERV
jgi:PAS domain S-box-containing protein